MDVISLAEAGFEEAVAPLGTALTEDQLKLLWRMSAEPILCFDGDSAGKRAAFRAVDTALPHLKPGASVMFAFLPDGLDPDDLVRQQGLAALDGCLGRARPLVDVLFEREWAGRRLVHALSAGLDWKRRSRALIGQIEDESVRAHYRQALDQRLRAAWGEPQEAQWRGGASRRRRSTERRRQPLGALVAAGCAECARRDISGALRRGSGRAGFPPSLGQSFERANASFQPQEKRAGVERWAANRASRSRAD